MEESPYSGKMYNSQMSGKLCEIKKRKQKQKQKLYPSAD